MHIHYLLCLLDVGGKLPDTCVKEKSGYAALLSGVFPNMGGRSNYTINNVLRPALADIKFAVEK